MGHSTGNLNYFLPSAIYGNSTQSFVCKLPHQLSIGHHQTLKKYTVSPGEYPDGVNVFSVSFFVKKWIKVCHVFVLCALSYTVEITQIIECHLGMVLLTNTLLLRRALSVKFWLSVQEQERHHVFVFVLCNLLCQRSLCPVAMIVKSLACESPVYEAPQ